MAGRWPDELGTLIPRCDRCTVIVTFPPSFAFPIGLNTYSRVYANNGYLVTDKSDYLEAFCCDLTTVGAPAGAGFYVNDQLPGKVVLTWYQQFTLHTGTQLNTIQIVLFADGRIQYGYNGIASGPNATVGLFPSAYSTGRQIDFSTTETVSIGPNEYVYENFDPFSNRFDLDNGFVIFTPAGGGGYELHPIPDVVAPVCSIVTPADGSTLFGGEALSITASATDNGGVSHVAFSSSVGGVAADVNAAMRDDVRR